MNLVILSGNLGKDPDVRVAQSGICVANFNLAVRRIYKRDGGPDTDWMTCTAFGKTAESIQKNLHKGSKVVITGEIRNDNYEKNGVKHYNNRIIVNSWEFAESKNSTAPAAAEPDDGGFMSIPEGSQEELPFI